MITMFSGWCGEVRDVIYSNSGTVTVVYRVILKGTDGEVYVLFFLFGRTSIYLSSIYSRLIAFECQLFELT